MVISMTNTSALSREVTLKSMVLMPSPRCPPNRSWPAFTNAACPVAVGSWMLAAILLTLPARICLVAGPDAASRIFTVFLAHGSHRVIVENRTVPGRCTAHFQSGGCPNPLSTAHTAISVRDFRSSLVRMRVIWASTVRSVITSALAISRFELPRRDQCRHLALALGQPAQGLHRSPPRCERPLCRQPGQSFLPEMIAQRSLRETVREFLDDRPGRREVLFCGPVPAHRPAGSAQIGLHAPQQRPVPVRPGDLQPAGKLPARFFRPAQPRQRAGAQAGEAGDGVAPILVKVGGGSQQSDR